MPGKDDIKRDAQGRFLKGMCPTKSPGRPAIAADFRQRCRDFMETKGWLNLESMANDPKGPHYYRANELLLAYALGKPPQKLEHGGDAENQTPIKYISVVQVSSEPKG